MVNVFRFFLLLIMIRKTKKFFLFFRSRFGPLSVISILHNGQILLSFHSSVLQHSMFTAGIDSRYESSRENRPPEKSIFHESTFNVWGISRQLDLIALGFPPRSLFTPFVPCQIDLRFLSAFSMILRHFFPSFTKFGSEKKHFFPKLHQQLTLVTQFFINFVTNLHELMKIDKIKNCFLAKLNRAQIARVSQKRFHSMSGQKNDNPELSDAVESKRHNFRVIMRILIHRGGGGWRERVRGVVVAHSKLQSWLFERCVER